MTDDLTPTALDVPPDKSASDTVRSLYQALNGGGVRVVGRGARVVGHDASSNGRDRRTDRTDDTGSTDTTAHNGSQPGGVTRVAAGPVARVSPTATPAETGTVATPTLTLPLADEGASFAPRTTTRRMHRGAAGLRATRPRPSLRASGGSVRRHATTGRSGAARPTVSWRQALYAGLVCFTVWLLLDAPTLLRSAQAGPLGARRTVAISVLRPVDDLSRALGLSHVVSGADRAMGRDKTGVLQVEGPPVHRKASARRGHDLRAPGRTPFLVTPLTAPDGMRPLATPTPAAPLQVLAVGDSLGIDFGQSLVNDLAATGDVHAVLDGHIDTGLARPDYFDWQAELQADLARYQPQAVVVFIGANDPQNFVQDGTALSYGTQAWDEAYASRVGEFMQAAIDAGARVLWVGMPPMADPVLGSKMQVLNGIYQTEADEHRGVTYFASWPVLSDGQGAYSPFLPDASGNEVEVREPDGTHISPSGAERLSRAAIAGMDHSWGLSL